MRSKGFTLIELLITLAMIGIFAAILIPAILGSSSAGNQTVSRSYGLAGYVEQRCINGLLFTVTQRNTTQVYDQFGHGVVCNK
jgi:prepilin-type N-terminal cleavage/methylation domain-containing protein